MPGAALRLLHHRPAAGTGHGPAGTRRRAARAPHPVRDRARRHGGALGRRSAGSSPAACCGRCAPSPRPPAASPPPAWASAWPSAAPATNSRNSATPSTRSSHGLRHPLPPSASSSPTPHTSCAPRWPGSGSSARSPWPTPAPPPKHSAQPTSGCSPPAPSRNSSSKRCSRWPSGQAGLDKTEPVDLAAVTRQVLAARRSEADRRNLTLHADLSPARAAGSPRLDRTAGREPRRQRTAPQRARRPDRGHHRTADSQAVLRWPTPGPRYQPTRSDRLFQPFQRLGTDRASRGEGTGLGLSIVQAIADAHGASITARPQPGGGLLVEVTFPDPGTASPSPETPGNPHTRISACRP